MADVIEDIKARLDIVEVVSAYVQLKKAGGNYKGLCPFHSEKSPSFVVSPQKQICHCFGCNKGGDIFTFVQELEGVGFAEALEILADRAGIKLDKEKLKEKGSKSAKDPYFKAHDLACEFFEKQLWETADGKKVLEYLYKRGLKDETIREFRIGFAPDSYDELHPYLLKKGISRDVLIKSGLATAKNLADDKIYDKYRSRLIFPIFDYLGKVCGFGGRALKQDQAPKYLNSPENIIYSKSKVLYGLSHAKQAIKEEAQVILVEGYFDVALPYQAGIKNIVATSGIALTQDQAKLLKRLATNAITSFDTDEAGFEATKRAYFILQQEGFNVRTVAGLDKKDPADFVLENGSKFKEVVADSPEFISFFIEKLVNLHDVNNASGRSKILSELLPCFKIMLPSMRDFFIRELSRKINIQERFLYEEIESFSLPVGHPARLQNSEEESKTDTKVKFSLEEVILGMLLEHPALLPEVVNLFKIEDFEGEFKSVYKHLTDQYNHFAGDLSSWDLEDEIFAGLKDKIAVLRLYTEEENGSLGKEVLKEKILQLVKRFYQDRKNKLKLDLVKKMEEAEKSGNKEELLRLIEENNKLLRN